MLDLSKVPPMAESIPGWFSKVEHGCLLNLAARVARPGAIFVEVGSYLGRSTQALARVASMVPGGMVYIVDNWSKDKDNRPLDYQRAFIENMVHLGLRSQIAIMFMDSLQAAAIFQDGTADLVFIDASHRYLDVKADIAAWLPKVRKGGLFAGHDIEARWTDGSVQMCVPLNTDDEDMVCLPQPDPGRPAFCCHVNVIRAVTEAFGEDYERERSGNTVWWKEIVGGVSENTMRVS
jgi:predicted O-methyltransferase YrrM